MVDRLADVMQQTGTAGNGGVDAKFGGEHTGDVCDLDRVQQHVLSITGAVMHAAEQANQLGMDAMNTGFERGAFALGFDDLIDFLLCLLHHFRDARRMDATVQNQLFQTQPGDFTANRVKRGQGDCFRGIVDDQIDTRQVVQGADVAAFTANDAARHFIVGQRNDRYRGFGYLVGCIALDGRSNEFARSGLGFLFHLLVDFAEFERGVMLGFIFNRRDQIFLGLVAGQTGQTLERGDLLGANLFGFFLGLLCLRDLAAELFALTLHRVRLLLKRFFLLVEAVLGLLNLAAALLEFPIGLGAGLEDFILGFQDRFALLGFSGLDGLVYDAGGLLFCASNCFFCDIFTV